MKKIKYIICFLLIAVCGVFFVGCGKNIFQVKEVDVSPAFEQGMKLFTYDEIKNERVTIRQPVMEVLERGLPRTEPQVLSNTFTLPNFTTHELTKVSATFEDYPGQNHAYTLSNFKKYMLLRQSYYYSRYALKLAEEGKIAKHPAADLQYGAVKVENNAVKKRIVTDPDYKRAYLTTGLYLPAGEICEVEVKGLKAGESIMLFTNLQQTLAYAVGSEGSYFNSYDNLLIQESQKASPDYEGLDIPINSQYNRQNTEIPVQEARFVLTENRTYKIGAIYGGQIHINCASASTPVELVVTGCVETPHFILGVTSNEEFDEYLRNSPGVMGTLDTENGQLVGPASYFRNVEDMLKVAYMWHSNFAIDISYTGKAYNHPNILKFDRHVPAGAAVALDAYNCAMPDGWLNGCLNFDYMKSSGNWGTLHELGHTHQGSYGRWGMGGSQEGEVTNNALTVLIYLYTCNMDPRVNGIEHGESCHPYSAMQSMLNAANRNLGDYNDYGYFEALSLYANLMHQLTPAKFIEYLYSYQETLRYCTNQRADFAYRLSLVNGLDFRPFLNEMYKANITDSMFSEEQLKEMNKLDKFWPIACYYANGVGEGKSAAKYIISPVTKTEFEFENKILCPKPFKIVEITSPKYGKLKKLSKTKVEYTPSKAAKEEDEFYVVCDIEGGLRIKLPVRLRYSYRQSYSQVWKNLGLRNIDTAIAATENVEFTSEEFSTIAGKSNFTSTGLDYAKSTFNFRATESGEHQFYMIADDIGRMVAGENGEYVVNIGHNIGSYQEVNSFKVTLKEGELFPFTTHLINTGGGGYFRVGVKKPGSTRIVDVSGDNLLLAGYTEKEYQAIIKYGWQPVFVDSIKNYSKATYVDKTNWEVLSAPIAENGYNTSFLIDGNNSSIYHTKYSGGTKTPMPHEYIIDMGDEYSVNAFEVVTRNNVNSYIREYELYGSLDNQKYKLLSSGETLEYSNLKATITFKTQKVRYFKLVAKTASGGNFTVVAEFNAGSVGQAEQMVKLSGNKSFMTSGFKAIDQGGTVAASKKGSALVMQFSGKQFNVFANTSLEAGRIGVYVDGKLQQIVSLEGENQIGKLVFVSKEMKNSFHTVEIIALDEKEVEITSMSINYGASLLNAANIYKERALGISLAVFCCLFVAMVAFVVCYFTIPKFREFVNKVFKPDRERKPKKEKLDKKTTPENKGKEGRLEKKSQASKTSTTKAESKKEVKIQQNQPKNTEKTLKNQIKAKETKPTKTEVKKTQTTTKTSSKESKTNPKATKVSSKQPQISKK